MKISHIGIAVKSIKDAKKTYELLGLKLSEMRELPERNLGVAFFEIGESRIELIESLGKSAISNFLEKRGEGLHHVALEVEDIRENLKILKENGYRLIDEKPQRGADGLVAFLHPKSTNNVLIELTQKEYK
ncbi:MAG: methylmalonyl-CoA epimerase [Candidatus Methanofastidiosia archaeon]